MNEGGLWKWGVSLCGSFVRGTWKEGSFTGDPETLLIKALATGNSLHKAPFWGTWGDFPFLGPSREEKNFFYQQNFYEELEK